MIKMLLIGLLFVISLLVACSPVNNKVLNVQEVKYIAKYHNNVTVSANESNVWYDLPFNIYVGEDSTQGFMLGPDNKSVIVQNFTGIVRVGGCLHPYNIDLGTQEATIRARVLVNGVEQRCTQASRSKSFKTEGVDIITISGTISVKHDDVIRLQWRTTNSELQLLDPDSVFDFPVSHTLHFERMK